MEDQTYIRVSLVRAGEEMKAVLEINDGLVTDGAFDRDECYMMIINALSGLRFHVDIEIHGLET
jgi:hypothetical protein